MYEPVNGASNPRLNHSFSSCVWRVNVSSSSMVSPRLAWIVAYSGSRGRDRNRTPRTHRVALRSSVRCSHTDSGRLQRDRPAETAYPASTCRLQAHPLRASSCLLAALRPTLHRAHQGPSKQALAVSVSSG